MKQNTIQCYWIWDDNEHCYLRDRGYESFQPIYTDVGATGTNVEALGNAETLCKIYLCNYENP